MVSGWWIPCGCSSTGTDMRTFWSQHPSFHARIFSPHLERWYQSHGCPTLFWRTSQSRPRSHKRRPSLRIQQPLSLLHLPKLRQIAPKARGLMFLDIILLGSLTKDPRTKHAQYLPRRRVPGILRLDLRPPIYPSRTIFLRQRPQPN